MNPGIRYEQLCERRAQLAALGRQVRFGLVGCGKAKLQRSSPARDLYTGPLFRKALAPAAAPAPAAVGEEAAP